MKTTRSFALPGAPAPGEEPAGLPRPGALPAANTAETLGAQGRGRDPVDQSGVSTCRTMWFMKMAQPAKL